MDDVTFIMDETNTDRKTTTRRPSLVNTSKNDGNSEIYNITGDEVNNNYSFLDYFKPILYEIFYSIVTFLRIGTLLFFTNGCSSEIVTAMLAYIFCFVIFLFIIPKSIGSGLLSIGSKKIANEEFKSFNSFTNKIYFITIMFSFIVSIVFFTCLSIILSLFIDNTEVIDNLGEMLRWTSFSIPLICISTLNAYYFAVTDNRKIAIISNSAGLIIQTLSLVIFIIGFGLINIGISMSILISYLSCCFYELFYLYYYNSINDKVPFFENLFVNFCSDYCSMMPFTISPIIKLLSIEILPILCLVNNDDNDFSAVNILVNCFYLLFIFPSVYFSEKQVRNGVNNNFKNIFYSIGYSFLFIILFLMVFIVLLYGFLYNQIVTLYTDIPSILSSLYVLKHSFIVSVIFLMIGNIMSDTVISVYGSYYSIFSIVFGRVACFLLISLLLINLTSIGIKSIFIGFIGGILINIILDSAYLVYMFINKGERLKKKIKLIIDDENVKEN